MGERLSEPRRERLEIQGELKAALQKRINNGLYASAVSMTRVRNWTARVNGTPW